MSEGPIPPNAKLIPLKGPAAALSAYMEQSLSIPTATSFRSIPVDVLDARRKELNGAVRAAGRSERISFTHIIAFALVRSARELPFITYSFRRDEAGAAARLEPGINLGLAVDTERKDGTRSLVVPVIRDADALDFAAFRGKYEELVGKSARQQARRRRSARRLVYADQSGRHRNGRIGAAPDDGAGRDHRDRRDRVSRRIRRR